MNLLIDESSSGQRTAGQYPRCFEQDDPPLVAAVLRGAVAGRVVPHCVSAGGQVAGDGAGSLYGQPATTVHLADRAL